MPKKLGAIQWKEPPTGKESSIVPGFKKFCQDLYPNKDKALLEADIATFSSATSAIAQHFAKFFQTISSLPLLSVVVFWSENLTKDKSHAAKNAELMQELIAYGYIGLKDTSGKPWTISHMISIGHEPIIEAIRCNENWTLEKIEEYVQFYIDFVNWLSEKTFGYVLQATDPDLNITKPRKIPRKEFIRICRQLKDRERVMAELLYYGGGRMLEEIVALKIEDIQDDFVHLQNGSVKYPKHVLKNLISYLDGRKKGYVFVDKKSNKIDSSVPYRALKAAASKLNLDPSFSFTDFFQNI